MLYNGIDCMKSFYISREAGNVFLCRGRNWIVGYVQIIQGDVCCLNGIEINSQHYVIEGVVGISGVEGRVCIEGLSDATRKV